MEHLNWQHLIEWLIADGMTQPQIAVACQCGQSTISDIARGATSDPRSRTGFALLRLARERGIDVTELITAEHPAPAAEVEARDA